MARTLCVWFPDWPLRRSDAPSDRPCFVVSSDGPAKVVVAVNDLARQTEVTLGLEHREAEGLCPGAVVLERDVAAEYALFEPVVEAIESLVPRVEVAEPGLLFVLLGGAVGYYGGERPLIELIQEHVAVVAGPGGRFGVADGPFASHWAARAADDVFFVDNEREFLAALDVSVLESRELADTFHWLGIRTLGDLAALPRPAVASRFGQDGLWAHRLASGEGREPVPRAIPPDLAVEARFEEPLVLLEQVGFAARRLAHQLTGVLHAQGIAPHRVEIEAVAADGSARTRVWRSSDPFGSETLTERVWWQLRAWIESGGVPGGLSRLRISPADLTDEGRQLSFFEDAAARLETERAVARVQALLGAEAVLEARAQGGRDPSERVLWHRWGEQPSEPARSPEAPWPGRTPEPSPVLTPPEAKPLEVEWDDGLPARVRLRSRWESVLNWAGPWRRVGRWWLGEPVIDRYQLVTSAGAFLCEVREGRTYLVGIYD